MKKLLITGFDPFGGETINPSWEAVKLLPDIIGDFALTKLEIPTIFGLAAQSVLELADDLQPDVILCIGQAGGRSGVTPELVGINLRDARSSDNAGCQPVDEPVVPGGPAAYFATVPVKKMVAAMTTAGFPASRSLSAGAFVCNDTLYTLLHRYEGTPVRVGFVHVPFLPSQAKEGVASMELSDIVGALTAAIGCL